MKKLFLSLTATLAGMASGAVSAEDLRTGIYLFASPRDHVLKVNLAPNDGSKSWTGFDRGMHETLIEHITTADREKRVGWVGPTSRTAGGDTLSKPDDFKVLNLVLHQNQLRQIPAEGRFTFQKVEAGLAAANVPLQAVY
jgi:hypothetical protein